MGFCGESNVGEDDNEVGEEDGEEEEEEERVKEERKELAVERNVVAIVLLVFGDREISEDKVADVISSGHFSNAQGCLCHLD